jgi:hypothetical protein
MVTNRVARIALVVLQVLMGLAAVGGGLDLVLTNGQLMGMPAELLRGSPFWSYLIPGLVLLTVGVTTWSVQPPCYVTIGGALRPRWWASCG